VQLSRTHAACDVCHSCPCSYPPSLLRIISNLRLFIGAGGLQQFLDSDAAWRFKFPTTLVFYEYEAADVSALEHRPNCFKSTDKKHHEAFAVFKPLATLSK
jgi:hypothetical protein